MYTFLKVNYIVNFLVNYKVDFDFFVDIDFFVEWKCTYDLGLNPNDIVGEVTLNTNLRLFSSYA